MTALPTGPIGRAPDADLRVRRAIQQLNSLQQEFAALQSLSTVSSPTFNNITLTQTATLTTGTNAYSGLANLGVTTANSTAIATNVISGSTVVLVGRVTPNTLGAQGYVYVAANVAGVGFTVQSTVASDNGEFFWWVLRI